LVDVDCGVFVACLQVKGITTDTADRVWLAGPVKTTLQRQVVANLPCELTDSIFRHVQNM